RADGVAVVEDVGRMPAGDPTARPRPFELVRLEPNTGAVRIAVDGPVAAEQCVHVRLREEVRRGMRPPHRAPLPLTRLLGNRVLPEATAGTVAVRLAHGNLVALLERPALVAAECAHGVGRARTEELRHVEAARDGKVETESAHGRDSDRD